MGLFCAGGTTSTLSLVSGLSGAVAGCAKAAVLRVPRRLVPGTPLWEMVVDNLRVGLSPDQIAGTLKRMAPALAPVQLSHEAIYQAIYAMPRGDREFSARVRDAI